MKEMRDVTDQLLHERAEEIFQDEESPDWEFPIDEKHDDRPDLLQEVLVMVV